MDHSAYSRSALLIRMNCDYFEPALDRAPCPSLDYLWVLGEHKRPSFIANFAGDGFIGHHAPRTSPFLAIRLFVTENDLSLATSTQAKP